MKKTFLSMLALMLVTVLAIAPIASAFHDTKGIKGEKHIHKLKERGIIKGPNKGNHEFKPKDNLSYAQAAILLDDAFELSLAHIKFVKEPKASDIYTKVKDNQWYSQAFIDGFYNGVVFASDVNPNASISKEEFAALLITQLDRQVEYQLIEMYINYKDEDKVKQDYKDEIQKLLLLKFEELDKNNKFNPKSAIKREEAAIWLSNVLDFIAEKKNEQKEGLVLSDITLNREAHSTEVDKVTVFATVPHPGYSATISEIKFDGDTAYIKLQQVNPDPDKMYPQVVSTITLTTFIATNYKVKIVTE